MASEFEGPRTAVVTGGAKRIGASLCRALSADGWHLLIHCRDSSENAAELADELGNAEVVAVDLARPDVAATVFAAARALPPVRLLVNNAACFSYDAPDDFDAEQWDRHQAVNLRAPALLSQAFARQLDGKSGLIVNLLDAKLWHPNPDFFSYTISKYGLGGLTELLARAYGPHRIRVCGIAPSTTLLSGEQSPENFEAMHGLNLLGRGVDVEDIVGALRFVVSSPVLTGQVIVLDGGQRFLGLGRDVQFLEPQ